MRSHFVLCDKFYFGTGRFKDVFKQMRENPKVEIFALDGGKWLRYWGSLQRKLQLEANRG